MPLNNANMLQFVQNRESTGYRVTPGQRFLTPQPTTLLERLPPRQSQGQGQGEFKHDRRESSHDGSTHEEILPRDASRLELPVPIAINRPKSDPAESANQNVADVAVTVPPKSSRTASGMQAPLYHAVSAFDETQSIHFDDSISIAEDQLTQMKVGLGIECGRRSTDLPNESPEHQVPNSHEGGPVSKGNSSRPAKVHLYNGQVEADQERCRQGQLPRYGTRFDRNSDRPVYNDEGSDEGYEQDGEYVADEMPVWENTPSRTRLAPDVDLAKDASKRKTVSNETEEPASPLLEERASNITQEMPILHPINRFRIQKQVENNSFNDATKLIQPSNQTHQSRPSSSQPAKHSSKVSSCQESSSEEDQPRPADASNTPRTSSKTPYQEPDLDFGPEDLKTKTIADLDAIPFTTDPSVPAHEPALDVNGIPMTLSAKLTNLSKMRHEDQCRFFRSLTDSEREETSAWFLENLRSNVEKLTAARLERRKIALNYEMEVKKHENLVKMKKGHVDDELAGLKKGGGELIAGRTAGK
ncbi:uncharacterized protein Z518_08228 [Rhinocladiella mackenziei CBS 650.93]|uniref:Extracellular mutant protein 11 C-terminal domain-containing protein n=1 Tax=Rhinocladiella mackenziei CBS 650.93 TaxID=1442369 RepID=A0A0D2I8X2_9EURO|nr:uncharacterized protein Z518_08228 [Rhinocladiella mackenziei CBS 650.93]KIX02289.1 hypothetical protein Z518_08228 [Rhinocladiella mackenziei CBS 650.93]